MPDMSKTEIPATTEAEIAEAHEWNEIIDSVAGKDHLTGLLNRRALVRAFGRESGKVARHQRPLAAIFLDVDNFSGYNNTHGHPAGDKVLILLAQVLGEQTRNVDVPGRYGGEEFMILLPETDLLKALEVAERIRLATVSDLKDVTVSVGVAQWLQGQNFDDFVNVADSAMYYAKQQGKNRVAGITENNRMIEYGSGWLQKEI